MFKKTTYKASPDLTIQLRPIYCPQTTLMWHNIVFRVNAKMFVLV